MLLKILSIFIFIVVIVSSCSYECKELEYKNGLAYEKSTGNPANGKYECIETRGNSGMQSTHKTVSNFENGYPIGKWEYYYQDDLIQNGEYLSEDKFKKEIIKLTEAQTVLIETWYEGNYGHLNVDLYFPQKTLDSIETSNLQKLFGKELCEKHNLKYTYFRQKTDSSWLKSIRVK